MSDETKEPQSADDFLKNSSLYREFQAEREEILKHKWIESEKAGCDIGFDRALTDWNVKHRSQWLKGRPGRDRWPASAPLRQIADLDHEDWRR
jgi:hypothetical protein